MEIMADLNPTNFEGALTQLTQRTADHRNGGVNETVIN
jgi:hypothetical protein